MPTLKKKLNRNQFMAELARALNFTEGIPFTFNLESESEKLFLQRLEMLGLKATTGEITEAIADFFEKEKGQKWSMKISRFTNLGGGQFQVGLAPDDLAIGLATQISDKMPIFS